MTDESDEATISQELEEEAGRPRRIFLVLAAFVSLGAVAAYLFPEAIGANDEEASFAYVLVLSGLVMFAMFLVLCYRVPRIGNRFLGFDIVITEPEKEINSGYHYTGAFKAKRQLKRNGKTPAVKQHGIHAARWQQSRERCKSRTAC